MGQLQRYTENRKGAVFMYKACTGGLLLLLLLGGCYTAPEGDASWGLWFLVMGGLLAASFLFRRPRHSLFGIKCAIIPQMDKTTTGGSP